jgi:hypothetical protein
MQQEKKMPPMAMVKTLPRRGEKIKKFTLERLSKLKILSTARISLNPS